MNKTRVITLSAYIFAAIMILTSGCGKKEKAKPKEVEAPKPAAATTAESVQHKVLAFDLEGLSDKGAKKWSVKGKSAESVSENQVKLVDIVAKSFGDQGEATITADKGVYDKAKGTVRLEDNVNATIDNMRSGTNDPGDFTSLMNEAKDKVEKQKEKKTKTIITCDGEAEFDYGKNLAYFNKNVKVVSSDGTIDADRITINLDPAKKKVQEIIAEGNVKMTRGGNVTYSDKASYMESDKKVVLTGQPKIVIDQGNILESPLTQKGKN